MAKAVRYTRKAAISHAPRPLRSRKGKPMKPSHGQRPPVTRTPTRRESSYHARDRRALAPLAGIAAAAIAIGIGFAAFSSPTADDGAVPGATAPEQPAEPRVTFVAVGDNLPNEAIGAYADACAGEPGDGQYDYRPLYAPIKPYIEAADLAYMKEETHLGGDDIGSRGWPSFNVTDTMADAVVDTGFDLVASASNHSYDWGYYGAVEHSRSVWNTQPVAFTGTAASQEEADAIPVVERNGITFSLLDYTYGVNGYDQADLPAYAVNYIDEERIRSDVARAHELSDVVLVAMHWGTEKLTEADEQQQYYAQLLADLDVDVVLGSHPHVIGPLAWVEGASGHRTLVAYSLGNFLSNHNEPSPTVELEGMLNCTFVKGDEGVRIEDVSWTPLVNHSEDGAHAVYALRDYTPDLAERHVCLRELEDPLGWLAETTRQVVGEEFAINC